MKTFIATTFVLFALAAFSQKPIHNQELLNCKLVKGDFLYMSTTEVTNFSYLEFLSYKKRIEKISNESLNKLLPDTNVWRTHQYGSNQHTVVYFRHPAYQDYPVVGLTKYQANQYCQWLSMMVTNYVRKNFKIEIDSVYARLPTNEEWEWSASSGNKNQLYPWNGNSMRNDDKKFQGEYRANFLRGRDQFMGIAGQLNDISDLTSPAKSYWSNGYGLYNMAGNVSEMVSEDGFVKGGSWKSQAMNLEIDTSEIWDGTPSSNVGFRYVLEVVSFKNKEKNKKEQLTAKMIEQMLAFVPSGNLVSKDDTVSVQSFLASKYEVSNQLYSLFTEEHPEFASKKELWKDVVPYSDRLVSDYSNHHNYSEHPVVNISKESAIAFCDWLSAKYSSFANRKYENLKFRLPLEEEWMYMAKGDNEKASYPWGGRYIQNSKGCYLANHSTLPLRFLDYDTLRNGVSKNVVYDVSNLDGLYITGKVDSYHPNSWGLYNLSGNVAEMISDKEILKGGSWRSFSLKLMIRSNETYKGANPSTGFRFIATLLERDDLSLRK